MDLEKKLKQINPGNKAPNYDNGIKLHRLAIEAPSLICNIDEAIKSKRIILS